MYNDSGFQIPARMIAIIVSPLAFDGSTVVVTLW